MRTRKQTEAERVAACLLHAQSPSGCHALSADAIRICEELVAKGFIHKGPHKNIDDAPVYFAEERNWRIHLHSPKVI